jgi:hypothetical protein
MRTIALLTLFGIALSGLTACGGGKSSNAANNAAQTAASAASAMGNAANGAMGAATGKPNCGAVQAVWVNLKTKVYHEPSDPMYGKTKHGEYLCPSQAQAQGFRPAGGAKRHKKSSSM